MDDVKQEVTCDKHGPTSQAVICQHLFTQPRQKWFSDLASIDNRWPDAWCAECEHRFQQQGGSQDDESEVDNLKLICQHCYDNVRGDSVAHCMSLVAKSWEPYITRSFNQLKQKQALLQQDYGLNSHKRWDWDQHTGLLVFSNNGVPTVNAAFEFTGSIASNDSDGGSWMWAWANTSLSPLLRSASEHVRDYGDEAGFENLTVPVWPADEVDGWEMTAVAANVLGAKGAYRTPGKYGFTYMVITEINWVSQESV